MARPFTFANQTFIRDENYCNLGVDETGKTRTPGDGSDTISSMDPSEHVYLEIAERKGTHKHNIEVSPICVFFFFFQNDKFSHVRTKRVYHIMLMMKLE